MYTSVTGRPRAAKGSHTSESVMEAQAEIEALTLSDLMSEPDLSPGGELDLKTTRLIPYDDLVEETFPLTENDLSELRQVGPLHSTPALKHIRAFHKVVALKLAMGIKPIEICRGLAITPQTICKLEKDPQFSDMVDSYRENLVEKAIDLTEMISVVALEALNSIHERMLDPELRMLIPFKELREVADSNADRSGHSPIRRTENLHRHQIGLSAEAIDGIKLRRAENARLVEGTLVRSHEKDTLNNGAEPSLSVVVKSLAKETPQRIESEGQDV